MANSKLRCRGCKNYFPRDQVIGGFCSPKCMHSMRAHKTTQRLASYNQEFREVSQAITMRSRGRCEGGVPGVCQRQAVHVHHRKLRKQGGENSLENCIHLCEACHTWAHGHPLLAKELGLLVSPWQDPAQIPVDISRYSEHERGQNCA